MASTFPRWNNDTTPAFVYYLSDILAKKYNIKILAPHYFKAKKYQKMGNLSVYRFRYFFPEKYQRLCYDGGVLPNIRRSFLARIQVPIFLLAEFFSARKLIKKEKIDLVHAHWILPQGIVWALVKKFYGTDLIITAHEGDIFPLKNKIFRIMAKFALNSCDFCTVNSNATKKAVLSVSKDIKNIAIVPMGVDSNLFSSKNLL